MLLFAPAVLNLSANSYIHSIKWEIDKKKNLVGIQGAAHAFQCCIVTGLIPTQVWVGP